MKKAVLIGVAALGALNAQNNFQNPAVIQNPAMLGFTRPTLGQTNPVLGKPFSGVETRQTKQILGDGTPISKQSTSKIYRDAEGRTRSESSKNYMLFDGPTRTFYVINKSCSKHTVSPDDRVMIVAGDDGGSSWNTSSSNGGRKGGVTEDLGFQVINGVNTRGTRETFIMSGTALGADHDLKVVNESWYSDSLGVLVKSSNVDPRWGTTTYELSNINQSTPGAALFVPPAGCADSPPSMFGKSPAKP